MSTLSCANDELGNARSVAAKTASRAITVKVTERGSQAAGMVAAGDAAIVVQPVSELVRVPGIEFAGRIPNEVQLDQVFAAAIVAGSKEPDAGRRLIQFLASDRAAAAIEKTGMDLIVKRDTN